MTAKLKVPGQLAVDQGLQIGTKGKTKNTVNNSKDDYRRKTRFCQGKSISYDTQTAKKFALSGGKNG